MFVDVVARFVGSTKIRVEVPDGTQPTEAKELVQKHLNRWFREKPVDGYEFEHPVSFQLAGNPDGEVVLLQQYGHREDVG